jgi:benzodiazapine receptor
MLNNSLIVSGVNSMKSKEILRLIISLVICQLAGVVGSLFTRPAIATWYQALNKPAFALPNWLFAPVWTTLYLLMGVALFFAWRKGTENSRGRSALWIFFIQLFLNAFWSVAFFGLHSPGFGFLVIVLLWVAVLWTIIKFARLSLLSSILLWPYFIWVSFASVLNFSLWMMNR